MQGAMTKLAALLLGALTFLLLDGGLSSAFAHGVADGDKGFIQEGTDNLTRLDHRAPFPPR